MTKSINSILILLFVVLFSATGFCANDVTLAWNSSPTATVTGYKVYYKANDANFPIGALDTAVNTEPVNIMTATSPLNVGNTLSVALTEQPNNSTYFFAVTAYNDEGTESIISNIVSKTFSSQPMIDLTSPPNGATNEPLSTIFSWSTDLGLNYTLHYGTDPNLTSSVIPGGTFTGEPLLPNAVILFIMSFILLAVSISVLHRPRLLLHLSAAALFTAIAACGGGGGGGDDSGVNRTTAESSPAPTTEPSLSVYEIYVGLSDYYQAYNLEPKTTYYWKVTGIDPNDPNQIYTSETYSFTTDSY